MSDKIIRYLKKNYDIIALFIVIISFVVYKYPLLFYPYYWDEAWSYKPAIEAMYNNGPSLLPNSISVDLYKGHPLLFYFISSLWLKLFGNTIFVSKLLALFISVLLLYISYLLTLFLTKNKLSSIFVVLIIVFQSIFIAQSTLVLPEMLLALLSLFSIYYFLNNKKILFVISASLLLLTKETGVVLLFSIILLELIYLLKNGEWNINKIIKNKAYLFIPLIPFLFYFLIQKIIVGWFFYPEHIGYIDFGAAFFVKLEGYLGYLFIYQSRNVMLFTLIVIVVYAIIKKIKYDIKPILLFLIFIVFYVLFSSLNFYATRYILSLIPIFSILLVYIVNSVINNKIAKTIIYTIIIIPIAIYTFTHNKNSDHNRGYENNIIVQNKMIKYCEKINLYDSKITTHFLMSVNFTDSIMGYLSAQEFTNITTYNIDKSTNYAVISSSEFDNNFAQRIEQNRGKLIIEYKEKQAWCKLYKFENK